MDITEAPVTSNETTENQSQNFTLEFKGTASEYFRIWIVNIALTIATLGIYSAWAKVRTRRYFDNHTFLDGSNFDYHGDPIKILKGRLIIGSLFLVYSVGGKISPVIAGIAALVFFLVYPWVMVRSLIFNLGNTSYRGIRFGFNGSVKESYLIYLRGILVTLVSFGLAFPLTSFWNKEFQTNNTRYGKSLFRFTLKEVGQVYLIYLKAFVAFLAGIGLAGFFFLIGKGTLNQLDPDLMKKVIPVLFLLVFYSSALFSSGFVLGGNFNLHANYTEIDAIKMKSMEPSRIFAWIYLTNFIACIFSLGLLYPWSKVRITRRKMQALQIQGAVDSLTHFQVGASQTSGVGADAASDLFNLDLDLGF